MKTIYHLSVVVVTILFVSCNSSKPLSENLNSYNYYTKKIHISGIKYGEASTVEILKVNRLALDINIQGKNVALKLDSVNMVKDEVVKRAIASESEVVRALTKPLGTAEDSLQMIESLLSSTKDNLQLIENQKKSSKKSNTI